MRDKDSDPSTAETSKARLSAPAVGSLAWHEAIEERTDARAEQNRDWMRDKIAAARAAPTQPAPARQTPET